jgi:hypothetical protein
MKRDANTTSASESGQISVRSSNPPERATMYVNQ